MKKIILIIGLAACSALVYVPIVHAQNMEKMNHNNKDCVMMKDGKMMMMKNGKMMSMDQDMTMKNGTRVMMDGTVMMKNGKKMMMKDGQMMHMDGKMSKDKMMNDNKMNR